MIHRTAALLLCGCLAVAGCGADERAPAPELEPPGPGAGGALEIAVAELPARADPLGASDVGNLIARQVAEPLWSPARAPYQTDRRARGPASAVASFRGGAEWRVRLRPGIVFHDGAPLDGQAVLANVSRWLESDRAGELLGSVVDADAPRPDLVRIFCDPAVPDLDERLASPGLGLVSPNDITPGSARIAPWPAGTGPFEHRPGEAGRLTLARNVDWWGTRRGLGPAFDQVRLISVADAATRLEALEGGSAMLAEISPPDLGAVEDDPLLYPIGSVLGVELAASRSLRGITLTGSLSGAWPTTVSAAP